ncbi:Non-specific serine/threonine protein kinase protein [Dioscorea alata]|uniref:Non-specific serine/threonine protein kinase protein n=1 Tax=Dioscorea alata TaxID=55571 RepID=A0ACB7UYR0_DIOAL|nr:Non-specific serine/threonine protein kinase protein [Dioscorea alata]
MGVFNRPFDLFIASNAILDESITRTSHTNHVAGEETDAGGGGDADWFRDELGELCSETESGDGEKEETFDEDGGEGGFVREIAGAVVADDGVGEVSVGAHAGSESEREVGEEAHDEGADSGGGGGGDDEVAADAGKARRVARVDGREFVGRGRGGAVGDGAGGAGVGEDGSVDGEDEYNVLDYKDKVLDGFYDALGLPISASEEKIPSLVALQNRNLGFEGIVVNHAIDHDLVELEQVTQILVQRISELVAGQMGGPVQDASIMLVRWLENRIELRTFISSLCFAFQDNVGVPCKLVKGSQYIGVDNGTINIIKLDTESLIPADVLSAKDKPLSSWCDLLGSKQLYENEYRASSLDNNISDRRSRYEKAILVPSVASSGTSSITVGSSSSTNAKGLSFDQPNQFPSYGVPNSKQYQFVEGILLRKEIGVNDLNASSSHQSTADGKALFGGSGGTGSSFATGRDTSDSKLNGASSAGHPSEFNKLNISPGLHQYQDVNERINDIEKHDQKKQLGDSFMGTDMTLKILKSSSSPSEMRSSRLDSMLDDVAELEIPWEHLVIGQRIGLDSCGVVYGEDWNGMEVTAKKFLDQDFDGDALDELRTEVKIMCRLGHPNVVLFMGAVTCPPNLSTVLECLPRGSLYRILHRPNSQIEEKQKIKMALYVVCTNCLHTSKPTIVHCDLKSPNLLVCDFGLSRLKDNTFLSSKSTAGTPEWTAPEVLRNEPSNEKCDVYSFGVILCELTTLRMPWSGMNPMQVVGAVGFEDRGLEIPKEVDPLTAKIIWQCWQKDPNLRPSFVDLTAALKSLQRLVVPAYQDVQNPPLAQEIPVNTTP